MRKEVCRGKGWIYKDNNSEKNKQLHLKVKKKYCKNKQTMENSQSRNKPPNILDFIFHGANLRQKASECFQIFLPFFFSHATKITDILWTIIETSFALEIIVRKNIKASEKLSLTLDDFSFTKRITSNSLIMSWLYTEILKFYNIKNHILCYSRHNFSESHKISCFRNS